ncbi:MAG TPA: ATP-binding protein [Chitinophagaceae bacterium]|nr:ATP-binding protein [Chitinophagaceae bacterium]
MKNVPIPANEQQRLESLYSYSVMDTLPERDYDDITRMAAFICNTPIAVISLISENKQFFKSKRGFDVTETPRELAICAHAIVSPDELLMVHDLRVDERFADNPMVTDDPQIVFYAGMPMVTQEGFALGTICVLDKQPNALTETQQEALKILARQVINLMELHKKNQLLFASRQQMENFAFMASHDLREPLRTIHSFMDLLEKNYAVHLDNKAKQYISFAQQGARRATALINDLLALARHGERPAKAEPVDLAALVEEIRQMLATLIAEQQAVIHARGLPVLQCQRVQIKTVLLNLISNALKFHKKGLPAEVIITAEEKPGEWLFTVADNGIGIEPEYHETIFEALRRLHPADEFNGSGIGLAACRKIIRQQGGSIWVESTIGMGTNVHFTFKTN